MVCGSVRLIFECFVCDSFPALKPYLPSQSTGMVEAPTTQFRVVFPSPCPTPASSCAYCCQGRSCSLFCLNHNIRTPTRTRLASKNRLWRIFASDGISCKLSNSTFWWPASFWRDFGRSLSKGERVVWTLDRLQSCLSVCFARPNLDISLKLGSSLSFHDVAWRSS